MKTHEGWAPPLAWGPWIEFGAMIGGPITYELDLSTLSDATSPFEAELVYYRDTRKETDIIVGPATHRFKAGICVCVSRIRFRSYSVGQIIRMKVR